MLELVQEILIHVVLLVLGIDLDGIGVEMLLQYSEVYWGQNVALIFGGVSEFSPS